MAQTREQSESLHIHSIDHGNFLNSCRKEHKHNHVQTNYESMTWGIAGLILRPILFTCPFITRAVKHLEV